MIKRRSGRSAVFAPFRRFPKERKINAGNLHSLPGGAIIALTISGGIFTVYTIENDKIRAEVSDVGAELMSLRRAGDDWEYLWQGDPTYWASRASNLFPICGRLTEGKYTYRGKTYEMTLHGFARHLPMKVISKSRDFIAFNLTADSATLEKYPFLFDLTISYALKGDAVKQTFTVKNADKKVMPFTVGGHPGFNLPFDGKGGFSDCFLEFDCAKSPEKLIMSPTCFYTGKTEPYPLADGKIIPLTHEMFDNDAIFLTGMYKKVTLRSRLSPRTVALTYPDMKFLGLWHKPKTEAPYLCIEPWCGVPAYDGVIDDLETKAEMFRLSPGESRDIGYTIEMK